MKAQTAETLELEEDVIDDSITERTPEQRALRTHVRFRGIYQKTRIKLSNSLGLTADGKKQNLKSKREMLIDDFEIFNRHLKEIKQHEKDADKAIKKYLKNECIYRNYLKGIKGVGHATAGFIIASFNIHKATTVSKMWAYAGFNPNLVKGKKRIKIYDYKPSKGRIVVKLPGEYIIETDTLIRGDKLTAGFISPYNTELRTQMIGILAGSLIKQKTSYYYEYYLPYKQRLENNTSVIVNKAKEAGDNPMTWNKTSPAHRDNAAKRYMVKMFLQDLYVAWRTIEGLPVRVPYAEEYLGKTHSKVA